MMLDTTELQQRAPQGDVSGLADASLHIGSVDRHVLKHCLQVDLAEAVRLLEVGKPSLDRAIHLARRRLKRVRTLLIVVRKASGSGHVDLAELVKQAYRLLAGPRDADAMLGAARWLARHAGPKTPAAAVTIVSRLEAIVDRCHAEPVALLDIEQLLLLSEARVAGLVETGDPLRLLQHRLITAYRKGRKLYRAALDARDPDDETLHEWRKQVKHRLHICQIISDRWSQEVAFPMKALDHLADLLGEEHDFANLARWIDTDAGLNMSLAELAHLTEAIARRRAKLTVKAFEWGARLYGQRTSAFARGVTALRN